ncbi:DUF4173 domain-containing protein [Bifidobacterium vespertilionis]|uniref:DUF4153 domain-containing protein n=1 Tax=Bifidobacterium vespertilionis TaxID=2562524 RepID=UPI001BDD856F|nr:DUF4173 domain-containing protein [Bifidobacterium vespertilionis]MBT1178157.1 DUF4173 domain-containing protein [Bifidobacterium vespertilionis]
MNTNSETDRTIAPLSRRLALAAAALAIPFLFDRLWLAVPFGNDGGWSPFTCWAMLCMMIALIDLSLFARRTCRTPMWWIVLAAIAALGVWLIALAPPFEGLAGGANLIYAMLSGFIVLPALLMTLLQLSDGRFDPYHPFALVADWFKGWIISPFAHWGTLAHTLRDAGVRLRGKDRDAGRLRRVGIALLITAPILLVLVPLLMGADEVFDYAVTRLIGDFDIVPIMWHTMLVIVPAPFVFSLLASVDARETNGIVAGRQPRGSAPFMFDPLIVAVVLGIVLALYAAFCAVQFTFLFAGAGLPAGYTYAEYARSGFFQLLFVAALNFTGFGLVLRFAPRRTPIVAMQAGLLAATGVMLASAFMRLNLYIHVYGLTWLRYASITFIALLAVLLPLAMARLFTARIPLVAMGFTAMLVWWIAIGYANPDGVIDWWNASHGVAIG